MILVKGWKEIIAFSFLPLGSWTLGTAMISNEEVLANQSLNQSHYGHVRLMRLTPPALLPTHLSRPRKCTALHAGELFAHLFPLFITETNSGRKRVNEKSMTKPKNKPKNKVKNTLESIRRTTEHNLSDPWTLAAFI
jgi:hypothetical protein